MNAKLPSSIAHIALWEDLPEDRKLLVNPTGGILGHEKAVELDDGRVFAFGAAGWYFTGIVLRAQQPVAA
jgi:hypothetical protein